MLDNRLQLLSGKRRVFRMMIAESIKGKLEGRDLPNEERETRLARYVALLKILKKSN